MRFWSAIMTFGILGFTIISAQAQKPPVKGPQTPPINPAQAKLDITVSGLDGPGFSIAYGSAADVIAVGCEHGTIEVFKKETLSAFKTGKGEPVIWKGHQGPVLAVEWHGGPVLVSAGADKKINFRNMPDGKIAQSGVSDFRIKAAALSADGKTFASAGESNVIQLWDVASGKPTTKLTDNMDWTISLAFSADGKQLLSGDMHGGVRLWEVAGSKKIAELPAKPTPAPKVAPEPIATTCLAFAPDGKTVVLGSADGPIHLVNLADRKILRTLLGHTSPVTGIVFHPSGTLMASCSKDRTVKLWNPAAPQPLKSLEGHTAWIEGITFIEQATKLATVSADSTVRIWDLAEPPKKK